jgi:hypothetical protein
MDAVCQSIVGGLIVMAVAFVGSFFGVDVE